MTRRSPYARTKVSADLPTTLVMRLDQWKRQIDGINRSQLITDLLGWALDHGAINALYPDCNAGHRHPPGEACDCPCPTCGDGQ